jgi:arylsulfatase A-like enzyme
MLKNSCDLTKAMMTMGARSVKNSMVRNICLQRISRAVGFLLLTAAVLAAATPAAAGHHPHVVIMLADDAGWGDFSFVGNTNLATPVVDSIARDGAVFEQFFVQPVCAPTRAEFLTGRYHPRSGVRGVTLGEERMAPDEQTIADVFSAAGYATGLFGKWHNGTQWPYHPLARGFDTFYGFTEGHWGDYFDPPMQHDTAFVTGKGYITDDITTQAISFLEKHLRGPAAQPVLCYIAYNTPHSPMCVPDADFNRFADRPLTLRGPQPDKEDQTFTRAALAMVENLDWNVGRVLETIAAADAGRETIVVFFSDNGPNSGRWCGGMRGKKGSTDDGGVRSVCCLRFPGRVAAGTRVRQVSGAIDLLPTLAALAGINFQPTKSLDGVSLAPLLEQQTAVANRRALADQLANRHIISSFRGRVSVRTERYRCDHEGRLYDIQVDPGQTKDLAMDQSTEAERLRAIAAQWRDEVLEGVPTPEIEWFPVGAVGAPMTELPARDGRGEGRVVRSGRAANCSYFTNWIGPEDAIVWDIEVHTAGRYEAELWYTCAPPDIGSVVRLTFGDAAVITTIRPAWDPILNTGEDRVDRGSESYVKPFRVLPLGEIDLAAGRGELRLQATRVPGGSVADVRRLVLRPLQR